MSRWTISSHFPEMALIGIACLIVAFGFSRADKHVIIDMQGSTDTRAMATAVPDAPPLSEIAHMRVLHGDTLFSIDTLRQETGPDLVIADHPRSVSLSSHAVTFVNGWAIDKPRHTSADAVFVTLNGRVVSSCRIAGNRPDVAATLHNAAYAKSGFSCAIASSALPPGKQSLGLDIIIGAHAYYAAVFPTVLLVR